MYSDAESVHKAKEELNDKKLDEKYELPLYVDSLQKKSERKRVVTTKLIENNNKLNQENKDCNLYVKNLSIELTEEKMKEVFSKVGEVKSVKIDKYILQTKINGENQILLILGDLDTFVSPMQLMLRKQQKNSMRKNYRDLRQIIFQFQ